MSSKFDCSVCGNTYNLYEGKYPECTCSGCFSERIAKAGLRIGDPLTEEQYITLKQLCKYKGEE